MLNIKAIEARGVFAQNLFFERTEKVRASISECTREELMDLSNYFLNFMEASLSELEKINSSFEDFLGWSVDTPIVKKS